MNPQLTAAKKHFREAENLAVLPVSANLCMAIREILKGLHLLTESLEKEGSGTLTPTGGPNSVQDNDQSIIP